MIDRHRLTRIINSQLSFIRWMLSLDGRGSLKTHLNRLEKMEFRICRVDGKMRAIFDPSGNLAWAPMDRNRVERIERESEAER